MVSTASHSNIAISWQNIRDHVVGCDVEIPIYGGKLVPYINFDNAASTPTLKPVLDKINDLMVWYSNVDRGTGFKSRASSCMFDEARNIVASFVNADLESKTIIFGKNATEAINKLAHRFPMHDDELILVSKMEHHSNDLPWRARAKVIHIEIDEQGRLDENDLIRCLNEYKGQVALFAVTGASNVTGWLNDIHRIAEICHSFDVPIVVDAAQLVPHRKVDMRPPDDPGHIDFLAFSAHKIYAPFGTGVLIGNKEAFTEGDPDFVGGGMVDFVSFHDAYWSAVPNKEEAGTPNIVGVIALAKALLVMEELQMDKVVEHEARLTSYALRKLREIPNVFIYGGSDPDNVAERLGVISFNVGDVPNNLAAAILNYEGGIGVRSGRFCAHPYVRHLMKVSEEEAKEIANKILNQDRADLPGAVRMSFGIYNNEDEIDVCVELLQRIARNEWQAEYDLDPDTGHYRIRGFDISYSDYLQF
ncbi:aminotransferase class V-fold PLP-dependent enzyme [bacterium]|nr:aminotransferase class V-fold PLP-dependent enzyme [bacterium]